jgi:pimeloyl-ACP methyl ester carboxylesterase
MRLCLDDDAELFYTVDDFTDPWTAPETVVLHHGLAKDHRFWYRWVPVLARRYRVLRFDNRGMGQSDVPGPGYPFSLAGFVNDLRQVLDHFELGRIHLIGESVGGTVAYQFAHDRPERLHTVTACGSPYEFTGPYYLASAEAVERHGVQEWVRQTTSMRLDPDVVSPEYAAWYAAQMSATRPWVISAVLRGAAGSDLTPVLRQIRVPTLILASGGLENRALGDYERAAEIIPDARLVSFPEVRGFVQHVLPERCAEAWVSFASEVRERGGQSRRE